MNASEYIYLDYAASTPVLKEVIEEMMPFYTEYCGNPSNSINAMGDYVDNAINKSKDNLFGLLKAQDYEIVFNSGATEGINTCLKSLYSIYGGNKKHIITCKTEHKAVIEVCNYLQNIGAEITYLSVDENGNIDLNELKNKINQNTLAVVLMAVNNETGVIHDIGMISELCKENSTRFVCDATQAVGKIKIDLCKTPIDYVILSGHKMYAPKGIGALLYKKQEKIIALIHGGGQQNNIRSGTLNVTGIVGLGKAASILAINPKDEYERIKKLQSIFENELLSSGKTFVVANGAKRSPFISNICFTENDVEDIIFPSRNLISFSTGSACTSEIIEPSYVLSAMGLNSYNADKCLRFSFGIQTTQNDINQALVHFKTLLKNV
jgi:cysteine desulfurase